MGLATARDRLADRMLGVGLHSYGFMDSAFLWLLAFVATFLRAGDVSLDVRTRRAQVGDRNVELTAREFAAANGLRADSLYRWSWEQRRMPETPLQRTGFTEVRLTEATTAAPRATSQQFELVLRNGRTLRVFGDVDPSRLRAWVEALESC